jgi:hypothetical protein
MRALSIVHESTGRRLLRDFYPMRYGLQQPTSHMNTQFTWRFDLTSVTRSLTLTLQPSSLTRRLSLHRPPSTLEKNATVTWGLTLTLQPINLVHRLPSTLKKCNCYAEFDLDLTVLLSDPPTALNAEKTATVTRILSLILTLQPSI